MHVQEKSPKGGWVGQGKGVCVPTVFRNLYLMVQVSLVSAKLSVMGTVCFYISFTFKDW